MRRALTVLMALSLGLGAACGGGGDDGGDGGENAGGSGGSDAITVEGSDFAFDPDEITVPAGEVTFELKNTGKVEHDLTIEKVDFKVKALAGQTKSGSTEVEAGTYEIYCSVAGHKASGMTGTLTVE